MKNDFNKSYKLQLLADIEAELLNIYIFIFIIRTLEFNSDIKNYYWKLIILLLHEIFDCLHRKIDSSIRDIFISSNKKYKLYKINENLKNHDSG